MSAHSTEIGSDSTTHLASWSCTCGAADVIPFARQTGEPVALRLARIFAAKHEAAPDEQGEAE